jgi:hypothetical protein
MVTANIQPTYYRVTFSGTTPNNFNALTANADGGLDCTHPERYNREIRIVGNIDATTPWTIANGNAILVNGVKVTFVTGALTLAGVVNTINALTQEHGVTAYAYDTNYLGLMNAPLREGSVIDLRDSVAGSLAKLGLPVDIIDTWPSVFGSASPTLPVSGTDIKINGVTVTFTGTVTVASVCANINALTPFHAVVARPAGSGFQLTSSIGQPFTLANGSTGLVSALGFTAGNQGGPPVTYAQSMAKERATMRWDAVVFELDQLISPVFLGEIFKEGTVNGTVPLTTLSWTVAYDRPSYLRIEDSTSPGTYLEGPAAIKRLIALALSYDLQGNQEIFDPTLTTVGNTCARLNPTQILQVTATKLNSSVTTIESNITVTQIANV